MKTATRSDRSGVTRGYSPINVGDVLVPDGMFKGSYEYAVVLEECVTTYEHGPEPNYRVLVIESEDDHPKQFAVELWSKKSCLISLEKGTWRKL